MVFLFCRFPAKQDLPKKIHVVLKNRLSPIVPFNIDELKKFKTRFWDYYGELLKYKENPKPETAARLSSEFDNLFSTKTGYDALDDRIEKTRNKKEELLLVLKYP